MENGHRTVLLVLLSASLVACAAQPTPQPTATPQQAIAVEWDHDPSAVIVKYYSPSTTAGMAGAYDNRYYIPEVQIWGDGRIVWVVREQQRRVLEGQLTPQQMSGLLQQIVGAGFFQWEEMYYTPGGHSFPFMYLQVNLAGRSKEIREHGGAPEAYYQLEEWLLNGAGAEGHDYRPTRGYLTVEPWSEQAEAPQWPADVEVTPDQIGEGRFVEGQLLDWAWDMVNRNPTSPVYVTFEGRLYSIMVQIAALSYFEPPQ
jgi:hypothetical protein